MPQDRLAIPKARAKHPKPHKMITQTTPLEAVWMTACPSCGAHKEATRVQLGLKFMVSSARWARECLCDNCYSERRDIVPFCDAGLPFEEWLRYALNGLIVVQLGEFTKLEP